MAESPKIVTPLNPVGADAVIAQLQKVIAGTTYKDSQDNDLFWFADGHVFPLARRDETTGEPILFWKGKDYFKTIPQDTLNAFSFFYENDPRTSLGGSFVSYSFSLVVWFNQDHYVRGLDYRIREFLINSITVALQQFLTEEDFDTITTFTTPESVYTDFTVQLENPKFKAPYDGFRISFTHSEQLDCGKPFVLPAQ